MARLAGIDVGGTFTDLVFVDGETGSLRALKVPSTPADQSVGFIAALQATGEPVSSVSGVVHGTTVGLNAVLERKGAACALLTTAGFRDVLELRRRDRPNIYGLRGWFEPIIPRDLRFEVAERTDFRGNVLLPVSEEGVEAFLDAVAGREVEVVIVSFLHAYANPENERAAAAFVRGRRPDLKVIAASDVLPEIREFERTSTAALNGFIQPVMARYLSTIKTRLADERYAGSDLMVLQCNGGVMSADRAIEQPVSTLFSGPAGGVVAGAAIARAAGFENAVCCDMGGTSFDVSLIAGGQASYVEERKIDYGLPMRLPSIDITSIGAGGGSIAWIDRAGLLRVGPQSAGANPGPVSYGQGGSEPTVTDANLVLGRINRERPIGREGDARLDEDAARVAIGSSLGAALGVGVHEAASAVLDVVNSNMADAIRLISVGRGHDPREFVLVAFGGGGPLHAVALARELGIPRVLVPPFPGVTSAIGCVAADLRHDFVQTLNAAVGELDMGALESALDGQRAAGERLIASESEEVEDVATVHEAAMGYEGQIHTVDVTLPGARLSREALTEAFSATYRAQYGYLLEYPVRVLSVRTAVVGRRPALDVGFTSAANGAEQPAPASRPALFGGRMLDTAVYERSALPPGARIAGPAIVEQADTTTVVDPDWQGYVDPRGNLILEPLP